MDTLKEFSNNLAKLMEKPPYLFFFFVSSSLLITSITFDRYFEEAGAFFLYSIIGVMVRYIEKDIRNNYLEEDFAKKASLISYHFINFFVLILLIATEIYLIKGG